MVHRFILLGSCLINQFITFYQCTNLHFRKGLYSGVFLELVCGWENLSQIWRRCGLAWHGGALPDQASALYYHFGITWLAGLFGVFYMYRQYLYIWLEIWYFRVTVKGYKISSAFQVSSHILWKDQKEQGPRRLYQTRVAQGAHKYLSLYVEMHF